MKIDVKSFFKKKSPERGNLFPTGMTVFHGYQGKGKTLSAVKYVLDMKKKFPGIKIYSNVKIKDLDVEFYQSDESLKAALMAAGGTQGKLILIDEMIMYIGKRTGISFESMNQICQQRKERCQIVGTAQIWEDIDVSVRKQVRHVVRCNRFINVQINTWSNGETLTWDNFESAYVAQKEFTEIFKHYDKLYQSYDTFARIVPNDKLALPYQRMTQASAVIQTKK